MAKKHITTFFFIHYLETYNMQFTSLETFGNSRGKIMGISFIYVGDVCMGYSLFHNGTISHGPGKIQGGFTANGLSRHIEPYLAGPL